MWVIIKKQNKKEIRYIKHKFIRLWLYILINKLKGNEVEVIYEKDI